MNKRKIFTIILTMVSVMFLYGIAVGQSPSQRTDIAEISNNGSNVSWIIKVPYESAKLTVSTPNGDVYRKEFRADSIITFSPITERGKYYSNGRFTYEIVLTPILSSDVKQALAQSRMDGNSDVVAADLRRRGLIPQKMSMSGTFAFENGNLITANDLEEESESTVKSGDGNIETKAKQTNLVPEDQQIIDDLIVVGSACVGQDCVNGENFGFDTLRLKENNLRINFDDTSNSGSFPFNDWRIVANDTSNGGASYLGFEDATAGRIPFRVEAGAPSNALVVEDSGQIGFGTINPVVELHVVDGDTPTLRLEQDGSSGFTAQTWDVAGNETNFFIRDATNGGNLPFRIKPGAGGGSININTGGQVGIGFNSNSGSFSLNPLEVRNNGSEVLAFVSTGGFLHLPKSNSGIVFQDGTVQTTAVSGSGFGETNTGSNVGSGGVGVFSSKAGTVLQFRNITAGANVTVTQSGENIQIASTTVPPLGSSYATTIFGGSGTYIAANSTTTFTPDTNNFGAKTDGPGYANLLYNIPTNPNMVDSAGTNTVIRVRYRDSDAAGTGANVFLSKITINASNGSRSADTILNSNNEAGTGLQTVTVCKPANYFNFSTLGNHLNVIITSSAGTNAELVFVQIYKSTTCP